MRSEPIFIEPKQTATFSRTLFVGPKLQKNLEKVSPGLDLTVDYGMLTFLSKPLFWLLDKIYSFTANWGWSIILLTILMISFSTYNFAIVFLSSISLDKSFMSNT